MTPIDPAPKPTHGGVFDSPLERWPGWFALPDPDTFLEEHWSAWEKCLRTAGEQEPTLRYQDIASALFVLECGEWHIEGATVEALAVPAAARRVPLKLRRWLTHRVDSYIMGIMNPKN